MNNLKLLRQEFLRFIEGAQALVLAAGSAVKRRWRQRALDALEAERLDRIRNPSRYLGKP
jgi:hypothetical protein